MPTVLVTGATGFLGSHLVKKLLDESYQVVIFKRSFSDANRIKDVLSELLVFDIDKTSLETPFRLLGKIDAVIHTATCYGRKQESISDVFQSNTWFPLQLLETAISFQTNFFFNTDTYFNKNDIPYLGLVNYSLSKEQLRQWGKQLAKEQKIHFVNIRIEHMFGGGDSETKFVNNIIQRCLNNQLEIDLTPGEQERDFIYIDDVVSAYVTLLLKRYEFIDTYQEYELGSGQAIKLRTLVEMIKKITQSSSQLNFGTLPYRKHEIMYSQANIEPLKKLGWLPKYSLQQALQKTIANYSPKTLAIHNNPQ